MRGADVIRALGVCGAVLAAGGCASTAVLEQELTKTNTQTVLAFEETAFNKHEVGEAFAHYIGPSFVQHDRRLAGALPDDRNGALQAYRRLLERTYPRSQLTVQRAIAQRDLVATQSRWSRAPGTPSVAIVDIFRVRDGRIVEHWDVVEEPAAAGAALTVRPDP